MKNTEVWIGQIEVKPEPGNDALRGALGAFVNVVGLASSEDEYLNLVEAAMADYGFSVINCSYVARLEEWKVSNRLHPSLAELVCGLTGENPVLFDEFQSYRHAEDA
jgi:hypothetical protein